MKIISFYGLIILLGAGCTKDDSFTWSEYVDGYVVGTFKCQLESDRNKSTPVGYCILLANNNDSLRIMDYYTFNLPDNIINYPDEYSSTFFYNVDNCGPLFLPDSLRNKFKVRFRYRIISENENVKYDCGPCSAMARPFNWEKYPEIILKNITKVEK